MNKRLTIAAAHILLTTILCVACRTNEVNSASLTDPSNLQPISDLSHTEMKQIERNDSDFTNKPMTNEEKQEAVEQEWTERICNLIASLDGVSKATIVHIDSIYIVTIILTDATQSIDQDLNDTVIDLIERSRNDITSDQITITIKQ